MELPTVVDELTQVCMDIRRKLDSSTLNRKEREEIVLRHIQTFTKKDHRINDFQAGMEWINVAETLSVKRHLVGKIVILDFFTYCCINCMHVLPDLHALEKKFFVEDGLVVLGVHSAKFSNERESRKLLSAIQRYNISHPVVNDRKMSMWRDLGIACWPSLVMTGPSGQLLAVFVGEGHKDELFLYVSVALAYFKSLKLISDSKLPLEPAHHLLPTVNVGVLFPGKVMTVQIDGVEKLVVSDSGNNRILVSETTGKVEFSIGGRNPGFKDGNFRNARFNAPQGVCMHEKTIYVADSENHAIRKIDLVDGNVTTVAGVGSQGHDYIGGKLGKEQALSSPWDVAIYYHRYGERNVPVLLIAIAGTHQIWALFLEDSPWWNNKQYKSGCCVAIVGSGREENRNNTYPHAAGLAQPSGLVVSQERKTAFFVDSESSSVRRVDLESGRVSAVCGANGNPLDLHDYGDVDGARYKAKLQHPLGITWHPLENVVYIADTYNHKIKRIDVNNEGQCKTVYGGGMPRASFSFDEPSGLTVSSNGDFLYVADTNNHAIKAIDLTSHRIATIPIEVRSERTEENSQGDKHVYDVTVDARESELTIALSVACPDDSKLSSDVPQRWSVELPTDRWIANAKTGPLSTPISVQIPEGNESCKLYVKLDLAVCKSTECIPKKVFITCNIHRMLGYTGTAKEQKLFRI